MKSSRLVVMVVLTLLAQMVLVPRIAIFGIKPDLTLLLLVLVSLRTGPIGGTLLGFGIGVLQDLLVPPTLGTNAFAKCIVGWGIGKSGPQLSLDGAPLLLGLVATSVLVHDFFFLAAVTRGDLVRFFTTFATVSIPTALYTAFVALLLNALATFLHQSVLPGQSFGRGGRSG